MTKGHQEITGVTGVNFGNKRLAGAILHRLNLLRKLDAKTPQDW